MDTATVPRRLYTAFISYRHVDNKEEGRRWAEGLHQAIETYEIPLDLIGKVIAPGKQIPATLYPVFRDELELSADSHLSGSIQRALEDSSYLIVLCSPRACKSRIEAHHAAELRKRMVPVKREEVNAADLHPELAKYNWVDFPGELEFETGAENCVGAIRFDEVWAQKGVRFLQKALDWSHRHAELFQAPGVDELEQWLRESTRLPRGIR